MNLVQILANYKLEGRTTFQGLQVSIENQKGSVRKGVGKDGKPWKVRMTYPYGYVRMSEGVDGDHVDCFLGPNANATHAYVIHTIEPTTGKYDEDKCMLGFSSPEEAKRAFLENYSNPKFFGSLEAIPMEKFKEKVLATKEHPQRIAASKVVLAAILNAIPQLTMAVGDQVVVDGLQGRGTVIAIKGGRVYVRFRNGLEVNRAPSFVHAVSGRQVP